MTNIKLFLLIGTSLSLISMNAYAESCAATPDCKSLGYTETSCPDGGVKCPWNTSLMYCCKKSAACELKSCQVGDVLYSDKKCYTCPINTLPGQIPIGVVFTNSKALGLTDLGSIAWSSIQSVCFSHRPGGVSGWYLPTKDELLRMYSNINAVQTGLQNARGGSKLASAYYVSSSLYSSDDTIYYVVNPVSGVIGAYNNFSYDYVRPVLAF